LVLSYYVVHFPSRQVDEVLPSSVDRSTQQWLATQLKALYALSERAALDAAASIVVECRRAAEELQLSRATAMQRWEQRLRNGRELNDTSLGLSVSGRPRAGGRKPGEGETVRIAWRPHEPHEVGPSAQQRYVDEELQVELWSGHYSQLRGAYEGFGHDMRLLHCRLFALVSRYSALAADKSAFQAALPRPMMRLLKERWGVTHECYASPLNRCLATFGSVFDDTDKWFGSSGSFYAFRPVSGCYEANPPFDTSSVQACFRHVGALLGASDEPLCFVVVVPEMDMSSSLARAFACAKPFLRHHEVAKVSEHAYLMGLQHQRTGHGERYWRPVKNSMLYFFQNRLGAESYPVTADFVAELIQAFKAVD